MSGMELMAMAIDDIQPVAFIADTHDDPVVVERILDVLEERAVEIVVHLGDVCTPTTLGEFADYEVHWITGNGDERYKDQLNHAVERMGGESHKYGDSFVFGTKQFYCRHGMEHSVSYTLARHGSYDYVMHGHWHHQEETNCGNGVVFNPGNDGVYLYHPSDDSFEWVEVGRGDDA